MVTEKKKRVKRFKSLLSEEQTDRINNLLSRTIKSDLSNKEIASLTNLKYRIEATKFQLDVYRENVLMRLAGEVPTMLIGYPNSMDAKMPGEITSSLRSDDS